MLLCVQKEVCSAKVKKSSAKKQQSAQKERVRRMYICRQKVLFVGREGRGREGGRRERERGEQRD